MLFLPAKPSAAGSVSATLIKAVVSVWPRFSPAGAYAGSICNISATVAVDRSSPEPLNSVLFLLPSRLCAEAGPPVDISATLLDPRNPLTYTTQGRYRKAPGADRLLSYDGLPDVLVDCDAAIDIQWFEPEPLGRISIRFDPPVKPDELRAVRFFFEAPTVFSESADGALHFHMPIQSDEVVRQQLSDEHLERIDLPTLSVARDGISGGFDLFFLMPLEFEGERFSHDPSANLLPDYDHVGGRTDEPRRKFAWSGQHLFSRPGTTFGLGENLAISGVFGRRTPLMSQQQINNIAGSVFIGSSISNSSLVHTAPEASAVALLEALEELREATARLAPEDPRRDLVHTHANAIEEAVAAEDPAKARRRLGSLRAAVTNILDYSPRALDLVERIDRLLGG